MNLAPVNKIFQNFYVQIVLLVILIFLLLPNFFVTNSFYCGTPIIDSCLDSSWIFAINLAVERNLIFGKDIVFTYGPLGFLATKNHLGISHWVFPVFDLFVVSNFAFILFYVFKKFNNPIAILICFVTVLSLSSNSLYVDHVVFALLFISIFWLNYSLEQDSIWSLAIPLITSLLLFFIKVNISFVGIVIFYFYLIYFIWSKNTNRLGKILLGAALPLLIILLSFPLNVNLPGYIRGSLSLIDGYNDALNLKAGDNKYYLMAAVIMIIAFLAALVFNSVKKNLVLLITFGIAAFVIFKQAFVRTDSHIIAFFAVFPALTALISIFYKKASAAQFWVILITCLTCYGVGQSFGIYAPLGSKLNYFSQIFSAPDNSALENGFKIFKLPPGVREAVRESTIDVVPWNIDYIYFNRLNYSPRPVIQSYSVYTPYLVNLNKQKYESDSAPEFVLFSDDTIDNRYAFFDDTGIKLSLIKDYTAQNLYWEGMDNFILFKRDVGNKSIKFSEPVEKIAEFGQDFPLADVNKTYFIKADLNYSLFGKAVRFVYKPFVINIVFTFEDGTEKSNRAILPILKNGVIINPYLGKGQEVFDFLSGKPAPASSKIKSFRIELDSPSKAISGIASASYNKEIKLSISEMSIERNR